MNHAHSSTTAHLFFVSLFCLAQFFGFSITANAQVPAKPVNLFPQDAAQLAATSQVNISWSAVPNASWYNVRAINWSSSTLRASGSNCPENPYYLCVNNFASNSISLPVDAGSSYGFFLDACNANGCGEVSFSNFSVQPAPPAPTPPLAPTSLSPSGTVGYGTATVQLSWNYDPNVTVYYVRANDNTDGAVRYAGNNCPSSPHYFCIDGVTSNSISMPVTSGHSYGWFLNACNSVGCSTVSAAYFNVPSAAFLPVHNRSSYTDAVANRLAFDAYLSTKATGSTTVGLFGAADHVIVTNNYVAWLSYSPAAYARSGALTGLWTINPTTQTLKYGRNQLIPGSEGSLPGGGDYFWDTSAPPVEHTLEVVPNPEDPNLTLLLAHNYIQNLGNGTFAAPAPTINAADNTLSFQTSGWMGGFERRIGVGITRSNVIANDAAFGGRYIQSTVEYRFAQDYVDSIWTFQIRSNSSTPASFLANNIYMLAWTGYAPGYREYLNGNTPCSVLSSSNVPYATFNSSQFVRSAAGGATLTPLPAFNYCSNPFVNYDINVTQNDIELISNSSSGQHRMGFNYLSGFSFDRVFAWTETHDGTQGFGITKGPFDSGVGRFTLNGVNQASFRLTPQ